ncbi:MAG: ABC transporter permease [Solirubrobacteraceae bacterium]
MTTTPADTRMVAQQFPTTPSSRRARRLLGTWRHPVIQALAKAFLTIFITTSITFFLIRLMPGNPIDIRIDELTRDGTMSYAEARAQAASLFSIDLDRPLPEQYISFLGNLAHGNLGYSFVSQGTPVTAIVLAVLPWTLFTVGTGLLLSFSIGIFLGLSAAYHRNRPIDHILSLGGSIVSSVPGYLIALLIVIVLGLKLHWVPIAKMRGAFSAGIPVGFTPQFVGDVLFHAALPISVFFLATLGHWILGMKSATIGALEEDYVNAARARGLSDGRIMTAYVGRNAVLPLVAQFAITAGYALGGSVLIEQYFVYQGVGLRLQAAVLQRDYPVMQGILLMVTLAVVIANLLADLLYSRLDPRIGRPGGATGT